METDTIINLISLQNKKDDNQMSNKDITKQVRHFEEYFQLEGLRQVQQMLLSGGVETAQRFVPVIIQHGYYQGAH